MDRKGTIAGVMGPSKSPKPPVFDAINIFQNVDGHMCLICNKTFESIQASLTHTIGREHSEMLDRINKSCIIINGRIACKLCSSYSAADRNSFLIHFHVNIHFHGPKMREEKTLDKNPRVSSISYIILEVNQIIEPDVGTYFCCCCGSKLNRLCDVVTHIEGKKHGKLQKSCKIKDFDQNKREHRSEELVKGLVSRVTSSYYYCYLCDCVISGEKNCHQHIEGSVHTKNMTGKADILYQRLSEKVKISEDSVQRIVKTDKTKETSVEQVQRKEIPDSYSSLYDALGDFSDYWTENLRFYNCHLNPSADPYFHLIDFDGRSLESCETISTGSSLSAESERSEPLKISENLEPLISKHLLQRREKGIYCPACEAHIKDPQNVVNHVVSREHIAEFSSYRAKIAAQKHKNPGYTLEKSNSSKLANGLISEKSKSTAGTTVKTSATNQLKSSQSKLVFVPPDSLHLFPSHFLQHLGTEIFCSACTVYFNHFDNVLEHVNGRKHKARLEVYEGKNAQERKSTTKTLNITKTVSSPIHTALNGRPAPTVSQNNVNTSKTIPTPQIRPPGLMDIPKKLVPLISVHSLKHLKNRVYCPACDVQMEDPTSLVSHTNSLKHTARLELYRTKISSENKTLKAPAQVNVTKEIEKLDVGTIFVKVSESMAGLEESLKQLTVTEVKKKPSIKGDKNKIQQQQDVPKHEKKAPPNQSKNVKKQPVKQMGFRPQRNKRRKPSCYDPKYRDVDMQHVYEVNAEKMRIMKLSCQLCFPKTSKEVYCLICEKSVPSELQTFYEHICSTAHSQYLADAEKEDEQFIPFPEQFSNLSLAKEFMQQTLVEETIQCLACDTLLENDDVVISKHIEQDSHKEEKQVWNVAMEKILQDVLAGTVSNWYNIRKYWCELCSMEFNTEFHFAEHMDTKRHTKCLKEMSLSADKLIYDSCLTCAVLWLGFSETRAKHCDDPLHKSVLKQAGKDLVCTLPDQVKTLLENSEAKVDEMIKLFNQVSTVEKVKANSLLRCLKDTVKPMFPRATAHPFGSRVSGLGFPDSDIDVFLDCGNFYQTGNTQYSQLETILSVHRCLRTKQTVWTVERTVVSSRTPIIRLHHKETALNCDVSFKSGLSVENTKLLKCFIDNYPLSRKLMLFIKKWLHFCSLSGSNLIINYAICWYTIFYLQCKSILPSVASLIAKKNKSKIIEGWETGICKTFVKSPERFTFTELLRGFFVFYANFDYRYSVACPLLGSVVPKKDFTDANMLPKEMAPYINHVTKGSDDAVELFCIDSVMCIQDPYDLSHNLTKAISKSTLNRFRRFCAASAKILDDV